MNISFSLTINEFLSGKKTCTRRRWKASTAEKFKKGSVHTAISCLPFLPGYRRLAIIRATQDAYIEKLRDMPETDLKAEGGMCGTIGEFIDFIKGEKEEGVYVARFEIIEWL